MTRREQLRAIAENGAAVSEALQGPGSGSHRELVAALTEALDGWENAELRPSVQAATDLLESKGYVVVHGNDQAALEAELARLREALGDLLDELADEGVDTVNHPARSALTQENNE